MVSAPIFLSDKSSGFLEIFLFLQLLSLIPVGFIFKYFIQFVKEKKAFYGILISCIVSCLGLVYIYDNNVYQYGFFFFTGMNGAYLMDSMGSSLFIKTYIQELETTSVNSGFIISFSTTSGRTIGSLMVTIIMSLVSLEYMYLFMYGFIGSMLIGLTCSVLILRRHLRVKAITKIKNN